MAKTLMIQGTTSDAGKTVMVAGLCRLLQRQGIKVAPFKPQNMALNSAVTIDGGEIGRAQALQAIACGLEPHTDMNPILLKPESDQRAQVIIHGKAIDHMEATAYHDYKAVAKKAVLESYQRLSEQYDVIIVEGAGSPAEINLRDNDLANMGFAEAVDCPVFIVADIDRGGVFAHLVGTLDLLSQSEQDRVAGFIINRFRGDIELLLPGNEWLEERTQKPVIGTVPYIKQLYLDAEDGLNNDQVVVDAQHSAVLNVVVPVLPRISNHTDFDALKQHPNVNFTFVAVDNPQPADLIILPGSKNVRSDLQALLDNGWQQVIHQHLRYGGKLLGICGGFQMLGTSIDDPLAIENKIAGTSKGLGLLDMRSELAPQKTLLNINGSLCSSALNSTATVEGYEIHAGISSGVALQRPLMAIEKRFDGSVSDDEAIIGTYIHGLFDNADACNSLLDWAGLKSSNAVNFNDLRQQNLNRLADTLLDSLDMDTIYQLLGISKSTHYHASV